MFFQINALTVGITKNGAITSSAAMFLPKNSRSKRTANSVPSTTVMISTAPIKMMLFKMAGKNAGSSHRYL